MGTERKNGTRTVSSARRRMSRRGVGMMAGLLIGIAALIWSLPPAEAAAGRPKNVIIMISDGCGHNHVDAVSLYQSGRTGVQVYEHFPLAAAMSTYPSGGSYDPEKAWSDFEYVKAGATDSAAAATAMSTGAKTKNGAIGVDADGQPLVHLLEVAESLGKATGVVSSVPLAHATPAGFVAHNDSRGNYEEIAREMIEQSEVDVIMGCGHPDFTPDGRPAEEPNFTGVGGKKLWQALASGRAGRGVDADHNGRKDDPWKLVEARAEFRKLGWGEAPKRVLGVPRTGTTLQYGRGGEDGGEPFDLPRRTGVPTLVEMTAAALNVLDDDPDGMFLMIEGGAVDWASHNNDAAGMIEEQVRFNRAVERVVSWIEEKGGWDQTLLIVTGDHDCGYLCPPSGGENDLPWSSRGLRNRGAGRVPGHSWQSGTHTNSLIPIYARGPLVDALKKRLTGNDPKFGPYLDNTDLSRVVRAAWEQP